MGSFLAVLQVIGTLFPIVVKLVETIQHALPDSGQGAIKLEMLKGLLEKAYAQEQTMAVSFEHVWPYLEPVVAGVVKVVKGRTPPAA
jgi:hypothetical protein